MTIRSGSVYLVGAGPGDPGLITVRGLELLRRADVVIHDRLVGEPLLGEARHDAIIIDAGKAPGDHRLTQDQINDAIVAHAHEGYAVVRLKGGDPYVFGRGWEELEACREAGIPCEVVPGITSAIAGPAAADIPVTARNVARSFTVVTARSGGPGEDLGHLDFDALARLDTVVFLMGVAALPEIVQGLTGAGRDRATPAAIIERATLPGQREVRATLATITKAAAESRIGSPAVIVVGDVAAVGGRADGPLAGRRIVVTRPRSASHELAQRLRELGATPIDCPLIRIVPVSPPDHAWTLCLRDARWLVFTSRHAVIGFQRALREAGLDARALAGVRIACVGPTTARQAEAAGWVPDLVPRVHRASGLIEEIGSIARPGERVIFARGSLAREELSEGLREHALVVDELTVYETLLESPDERTAAEIRAGIDALLFASPSAVDAFVRAGLDPGNAPVVCIGPTTGDAARRAGFSAATDATDHSDAGLIETTLRLLAKETTPCTS